MPSPTVFIVGCNWDPCPLNHTIPVRRPTGEISLRFQEQEALFIPSSWNASRYECCTLQFYHLFFSALVARKLKIEYVTEFLLLACFCLLYFHFALPSSMLLFSTYILVFFFDPFVCCYIIRNSFGHLIIFFSFEEVKGNKPLLLETHFNRRRIIAVFSVSFRMY